jgi:hypothetical protein
MCGRLKAAISYARCISDEFGVGIVGAIHITGDGCLASMDYVPDPLAQMDRNPCFIEGAARPRAEHSCVTDALFASTL